MGEWVPIRAQIWDTVVNPCECCGKVVVRQQWVVDVDGVERRFCSPKCEDLYRSYVLPRTAAAGG